MFIPVSSILGGFKKLKQLRNWRLRKKIVALERYRATLYMTEAPSTETNIKLRRVHEQLREAYAALFKLEGA